MLEMAFVSRLRFFRARKLFHGNSSILNVSQLRAQFSSRSLSSEKITHFGFETITEMEKDARGFSSSLPPRPWTMLDIAGGTGDIGFRLLTHCDEVNKSQESTLIISDVNPEMLTEGRKRSLATPYANSTRLQFMLANAESLENIHSNSIDLYTVAFGIRNFTKKEAALKEAFRVLRPGGVFACLEFSQVTNPLLNSMYKRWSFGAIPLIGQLIAGDRASYQYLVESIERFPRQEVFRDMIREAGFEVPGKGWEDLTGGIAAIHKGIKPVC